MTRNILKIAPVLALLGTVLVVQAQTATPDKVGVTQGTANEAASKAVPRSDTATLVRTAPNAVDKAKTTAAAAPKRTADATTDQTATMPASTDTAPAPVRRARKADRN